MQRPRALALCTAGLALAANHARRHSSGESFIAVRSPTTSPLPRATTGAQHRRVDGVPAASATEALSTGSTVAMVALAGVAAFSARPTAPQQRCSSVATKRLAASPGSADTPAATPAEDQAPPPEAQPEPRRLTDEDLFANDGVKDDVFVVADQIGVTPPFGFFDPLGLSKDYDREQFRRVRASEIKHGRVAMMASIGGLFQHFVRFPFCGVDETPRGIINNIFTPPGTYGWCILLLVVAFLELGVWEEYRGREPGDFGDPLGVNMYTEDMRNRELNNGRAAMFAALGILSAEFYTGKDAWEQLESLSYRGL